jgi:hypothetical protein
MKFLANENVPYATIRKLQAVGLDVMRTVFDKESIFNSTMLIR